MRLFAASLTIALFAFVALPAPTRAQGVFGYDASHWQYSCGHRVSDWARTPPCPDPGDSLTQEKANCMRTLPENPSEYVIFLAQVRTGEYFVGLKQFEQMALASNITDIDLYIWEDHINRDLDVTRRTLNTIFREEVQFGRIWLDIEDENRRWGCPCSAAEKAANLEYIKAMREVVEEEYHLPVGIYSGTYSWSDITGIKTGEIEENPFADLPYWWPNYGAPGHDFAPYASAPAPLPGWPEPSMRQWEGSARGCDFVMDFNWTPDYDAFRAPPHPYCREAGSMGTGKNLPDCDEEYEVRYGDSIPGIAACHGLDAAKLAQANDVDADHKYLENGTKVKLCHRGSSNAGPVMFLVAMGMIGGGAVATAYGTAKKRKQGHAEAELAALTKAKAAKKNEERALVSSGGSSRGSQRSKASSSRRSQRSGGSAGSRRSQRSAGSRRSQRSAGSRRSQRNSKRGSQRSASSRGSSGRNKPALTPGALLPVSGEADKSAANTVSNKKPSRKERAERRRSKRSKGSKQSKSSRNSKRHGSSRRK